MPLDLTELSFADEAPTAQEQARALAAALRGDQHLGDMLALTGDKVLAPFGQTLQRRAVGQQEQLQGLPGQRLGAALQRTGLAKAQREAANATSSASPLLRGLAKKYGFELPAEMTQEQALQELPLGEKTYAADKTAEYHRDEVEARKRGLDIESMRAQQGRYGHITAPDGRIFKQDLRTGDISPAVEGQGGEGGAPMPGSKPWNAMQKALFALRDDLDANKLKGGQFAADQGRSNKATNLLALLSQGENLDPRQMEEFAIGLQSLLSGSNAGSSEQVKRLIPHTWGGTVAEALEYFKNNPVGTDQAAFVHRMRDTVEREKALAEGRIREARLARLPVHAETFRQWTPQVRAILPGYGIDPALLDENLHLRAPPGAQGAPNGQVPGGGAAAGSAPQKDVKVRIAELHKQGLGKTEMKAQLLKEGYPDG